MEIKFQINPAARYSVRRSSADLIIFKNLKKDFQILSCVDHLRFFFFVFFNCLPSYDF